MKHRFIVALLAFALGGCHDEDPTGPHGHVTSIYVLRTVNGVPLPAAGNGSAMTDFTMIADTIHVYEDGYGVEVAMTSRPGTTGIQRQEQPLQVTYGEGQVAFDVNYECKDQLASCIAGPHHRGVRTSNGMTFTYSVMYRAPLVFERVGPILPE